jgi:outer membrane protein TolC
MRNAICGLLHSAAWMLAALLLLPGTARPDQPEQPGRSEQPDRVPAGAELRLTLDEAVAQALERSPRLRGARSAVDAAEAQRKQARAQFGPKLQFETQAMFFDAPPSFGGDMEGMEFGPAVEQLQQVEQVAQAQGDAVDQAIAGGLVGLGEGLAAGLGSLDELFVNERYDVTISARLIQPLTPLWGIYQAYKLSALQVDAARVAVERQRSQLAFQVRQAGLGWLQAEAGLRALEQAIETVRAHVARARHYLDAGLIERNDLLQAEVRLADLRGQRLEARQGLELASASLAMLLALPPQTEVRIAAPADAPQLGADRLPPLAELQAEAAGARPELRELDLRIAQAERGVRAAWQGYIPQVSLLGQYQHNEGSIMKPPTWTGGVVVDFNVWEWGATYYAVEQRQAQLARARAGREELRRAIDLEVRRAWLKIKLTAERMRIAAASLEQAREQVRLEQERYAAQQATSTDVLDAQSRLTRARVTADNAAFSHRIALAALELAVGRTPAEPAASPAAGAASATSTERDRR